MNSVSEKQPRVRDKLQLAIAIAQGSTARAWARANDVSKTTAWRWSKEPEVRRAVEEYRRRLLDRAVGQMAKRANWAAIETYRMAKEARSETVKLRAIRAILADMMAVSKFSGLECRMSEIEEQLRARVDDDEATSRFSDGNSLPPSRCSGECNSSVEKSALTRIQSL
jgi:hypothetical protein